MKPQIVDIALNGSRVRDTARMLHVSPSKVIRELKKNIYSNAVNLKVLKQLNPEQVEAESCLTESPEECARPES